MWGTPCLVQSVALCATPFPWHNYTRLANLSRSLGATLNHTWDSNFTRLLRELRQEIWVLNSTQLDTDIWSPFEVIPTKPPSPAIQQVLLGFLDQ